MRMRVVGWMVQPIVFADDGDNLREVKIAPVQIPMDKWQEFKDGGDELGLSQARARIEGVVPETNDKDIEENGSSGTHSE